MPVRPPQPGQLPFAALCDLFDSVRGQKCGVVRQRVQHFVQKAVWVGAADSFQLIRCQSLTLDLAFVMSI